MATRKVIIMLDDLDGTEGAKGVKFSFEGVDYEIDLTKDHYAELQAALEPYTTAGRRVGGKSRKGKRH